MRGVILPGNRQVEMREFPVPEPESLSRALKDAGVGG